VLPLSYANGWTPSCGSDLHVEMALPSPEADVKTVTSVDSLVNLGVTKMARNLQQLALDRGTETYP